MPPIGRSCNIKKKQRIFKTASLLTSSLVDEGDVSCEGLYPLGTYMYLNGVDTLCDWRRLVEWTNHPEQMHRPTFSNHSGCDPSEVLIMKSTWCYSEKGNLWLPYQKLANYSSNMPAIRVDTSQRRDYGLIIKHTISSLVIIITVLDI